MNTLQQISTEMGLLARGVRASTVRVFTSQQSVGAGTIWHPDGLILTNAHVVGRGRGLRVALPNGEARDAKVIAYDRERDLAALSVDAVDLPVIQPGSSSTLQPGAWVMALGHPWGVMNAATGGVVIGVGRQFPEMPPAAHDWVVVNLTLRPGHSGGPLVDVGGRLVGINTMMTGPEVGAAVAVDTVKAFLREALGAPANPSEYV